MNFFHSLIKVTGLDVFVWILLTAGTILVPIIVLTICCIRNHFKNEEKLNRLYRLNEKHGSGFIGPYGLSQDHLNRGDKQASLNPGVLIVNSALGEISGPIISGLDTPTTEKNKVRFIDDGNNNGGDRRMNPYNKNLILPKYDVAADDDFSASETAPSSDLRGLKDQINEFIPRSTIRSSSQNNNKNINNQLPMLLNINNLSQPQNYDSFTESDSEQLNRFTGTYNLPSLITSQSNRMQQIHEPVYSGPVYSITNSFRQQFSNDNNNNIQPPQTGASIENIYSKVLTVGKRQNQQQNEQNYDNDEQPLYMNTDSYEYQTPKQQENVKPIPPTYGSWNDSSV